VLDFSEIEYEQDYFSSDEDHIYEDNPPPRRSKQSITEEKARALELWLLARKRGEIGDVSIYEDPL
jgi:hypothetical protein